jgi:hypothetical protein
MIKTGLGRSIRIPVRRFAVAAAGALAPTVLLAGVAPPASAASVTRLQGFLLSVSATSASNAWAVGFTTAAGFPQTMILRWSGAGWRRVPSPNPGGTIGTVLSGVSAVSASDAWAVGAYDTSSGSESLALHWNGSSWVRVPAPGKALDAVSADSASDAWAVSGTGTVVRWNGTRWAQVSIPALTAEDTLNGVSALSRSNAWIVGDVFINPDKSEPLALHWDGTSWKNVTTPRPSGSGASLEGVSAFSASGAWAVGAYAPAGSPARSFALRWNGTSWRHVLTPSPGANGCTLLAASALTRSDAWAVGAYTGSSGTSHTVALHWNGARWVRTATPTPPRGAQLNSVSAISRSDAWAVGSVNFSNKILIEHWNGTSWSRS